MQEYGLQEFTYAADLIFDVGVKAERERLPVDIPELITVLETLKFPQTNNDADYVKLLSVQRLLDQVCGILKEEATNG